MIDIETSHNEVKENKQNTDVQNKPSSEVISRNSVELEPPREDDSSGQNTVSGDLKNTETREKENIKGIETEPTELARDTSHTDSSRGIQLDDIRKSPLEPEPVEDASEGDNKLPPVENTSDQNVIENDNVDNCDSTEGTQKPLDKVEESPEYIKCRNEELEGKTHPETGVPFERKQVEIDGKQYEVVVPEFESAYDATLPEDMFESSDAEQSKECNLQLKNAIATDKDFRAQFDDDQIEQIENGETPDGYTWHHDAEPGKMQLVDTDIHQKTGHTGGRSIWGGGTENR